MKKYADLSNMTADSVVAYIRTQIREGLGDRVENRTKVYASHGYYFIQLPHDVKIAVRRKGVAAAVVALVALAKGDK